jgi:hypothetical protein
MKMINPDLNPTPDPDPTFVFDPDLGIVHENNIQIWFWLLIRIRPLPIWIFGIFIKIIKITKPERNPARDPDPILNHPD